MLQKFVTNILMGFKILCQVGELDFFFSKLPYVRGTYNVPSGSSATSLKTSAKRESDGTGWTG